MTMKVKKIAVIGAGAWGTALAANQAGAGHTVSLWARNTDTINHINQFHRNEVYLAGIDLPENITGTTNIAAACTDADMVLVAIPAQHFAAIVPTTAAHTPPNTPVIICAKGIDRQTSQTMSQVAESSTRGHPVGVLSGPSFAVDVAQFLPTAVTVAFADLNHALAVSQSMSNRTLRCYASDDMVGVQWGGALKNVLAIAVGIARGQDLGASAEAALVARGFAEMSRVSTALGGKAETLNGLSGLGDLVLTCSSEKSRNFAYGVAIGKGLPLEGLKLAEGAHTAAVASQIAKNAGLVAPLIDAVTQVLEKRISVEKAIATLLARPIKSEQS